MGGTGARGAAIGLAMLCAGCTTIADAPTAAIAPATLVAPLRIADGAPPYRAVEGGRFELTRPVRFETREFGTVILTAGYRSDGSSSPIADSEATRLAGFLHDALYAASGHLRFPDGVPAGWTKAEADSAYCEEMRDRGASPFHARANCMGVRSLQRISGSWERLGPKREKRWAQWKANARKMNARKMNARKAKGRPAANDR